MRKAAILAILISVLAVALPHIMAGRGWAVLVCGLAGALWLAPSREAPSQPDGDLFHTLAPLVLVGIAAAGAFLETHPLWLLAQGALILVAWDVDHFTAELQNFTGKVNQKTAEILFRTHLMRLGLVVLAGLGLGLAALYLRLSLSFRGAIILVALAALALRLLVRGGKQQSQPSGTDSEH